VLSVFGYGGAMVEGDDEFYDHHHNKAVMKRIFMAA